MCANFRLLPLLDILHLLWRVSHHLPKTLRPIPRCRRSAVPAHLWRLYHSPRDLLRVGRIFAQSPGEKSPMGEERGVPPSSPSGDRWTYIRCLVILAGFLGENGCPLSSSFASGHRFRDRLPVDLHRDAQLPYRCVRDICCERQRRR